MENVYQNIFNEIDKEIAQLSDNNQYNPIKFWSKKHINENIKRKYRLWKNGDEYKEISNYDYYKILSSKENYIEEEFIKMYQDESIPYAIICKKYKVNVQTITRSVQYLKIKKRKRVETLKSINFKIDFVKKGYLKDLKNDMRDVDLMRKYNLTKHKHLKLKKFCLSNEIN